MSSTLSKRIMLSCLYLALLLALNLSSNAIDLFTYDLVEQVMKATSQELGGEALNCVESSGVGTLYGSWKCTQSMAVVTDIMVEVEGVKIPKIYTSAVREQMLWCFDTTDAAKTIWEEMRGTWENMSTATFKGYDAMWRQYSEPYEGSEVTAITSIGLLWRVDQFIFSAQVKYLHDPLDTAPQDVLEQYVYGCADVLYDNAISHRLFERPAEFSANLTVGEIDLAGERQVVLELSPKYFRYEQEELEIPFGFIAPVIFEVDPPFKIATGQPPATYPDENGIASTMIQLDSGEALEANSVVEVRAFHPIGVKMTAGRMDGYGTKITTAEIVDSDGDGVLNDKDECLGILTMSEGPGIGITLPFELWTGQQVDEFGCSPYQNIGKILELYDKIDLTGNPELGGLLVDATYYVKRLLWGERQKSVQVFYGGQPCSLWFQADVDGGIACGAYQLGILKWLDFINTLGQKFSGARSYADLLNGVEYGPVMLSGWHQAVAIYPSGTYWKETAIILDPWFEQEGKAYFVDRWRGQLPMAALSPSWLGMYADKYPITTDGIIITYTDRWVTGGQITEREYKVFVGIEPPPPPVPPIELPDDLDSPMMHIGVDCKVEARITCTRDGNRIGVFDGKYVNEISNADFLTFPGGDEEDDLAWYFALPADKYELEIEGTSEEEFHLFIGDVKEGIRDYGSNPIERGGIASITLDPENPSPPLILPDGSQVLPELMTDDPADTDAPTQFDFDDGQAQGWTDDGSGLWSVSDGVYTMTGNGGDQLRGSHYDQELSDFGFQADVRKLAGDGGGTVYGYGLHVRSDGTQENYYEFNILYDGRFMVGKSVNWNFSKPVDWTMSEELRVGYNQWNTLKVVARGSILEFYANGVLLATIEDSTFSAGKVGLFAVDAATSQEPDTVQFDNVFIGDPDTVIPTGLRGDVDNDGRVRSNDAALTLRIVAQLMIPDDYQSWAADMNGDGRVRSNDASLILRKSAGLAAPGANAIASVGRQIKVTLSEARGVAGENITVPVWINNAHMLASGYISIAYDSSVLRATDISSDSDALMVSNTSEPGILHIAFAGTSAMNVRTLARIQFNILADDASPLTLKNVELYGPDALPLTIKHLDSKFRSWAIAPEHSALLQNFPNPFNPETWIPYQLKEESQVAIRIYETSGKLVRELDLGHKPAGVYISRDRAAYWDGKDKFGINMASGLYFVTIKAGDFAFVRKMSLLK